MAEAHYSTDLKEALGGLLTVIEEDPRQEAVQQFIAQFTYKGQDFVEELRELAEVAFFVRTKKHLGASR
jgi:hypothetical protein